ncbi:hypothetical protein EJ06DRAFT_529824 [Trichodelitschia bisporula]|uniref:Uncharacterized protein n=1 Tax=Trichodelitschia bisporula TaxID=703511 RepID=A0A6G1HXZ2_9PEZI|nr:hypothetical protein EJ06DRAFT_529824 [Trichodelitschia bisporula]
MPSQMLIWVASIFNLNLSCAFRPGKPLQFPVDFSGTSYGKLTLVQTASVLWVGGIVPSSQDDDFCFSTLCT